MSNVFEVYARASELITTAIGLSCLTLVAIDMLLSIVGHDAITKKILTLTNAVFEYSAPLWVTLLPGEIMYYFVYSEAPVIFRIFNLSLYCLLTYISIKWWNKRKKKKRLSKLLAKVKVLGHKLVIVPIPVKS